MLFIDEGGDIVLGIGQVTAKANQKSALALFVNHGERRGVIHGVYERRIGKFTALSPGSVGFVDLGEGGGVAGECHNLTITAVNELFEAGYRVTLGVDRDK